MIDPDKTPSSDKLTDIADKLEQLNSQIDDCNLVLLLTDNINKKSDLLDEIKGLYKQVRKIRKQLLPEDYHSGKH